VRLAFVLVGVLYVINGLVRNDRLVLANRLFERSRTNKKIQQTNMSQYKI
jgi:uncharacterized membrane protein